jgi:hypothetical protein
MIIIIDLDLQQAVQGFGSRQPAPALQVKSQDTPTLQIYFAKGNVNYDLGASPGLRFGVFVTGNPNALVQYTTFSRLLDELSRVTYVGYPNFNTIEMIGAIGSAASLSAVAEIRYQTTFGTIARTLDIPVTVMRSLLSEMNQDTTLAGFTVPAVNSNVTVRINNTGWLSAGLNVTIGGGAGAYQVVSITNATDFVAQNLGGASNAAPATVIASGVSVGITPAHVIATYPDASLLELITRKGVASGYAGLNSSAKLIAASIPVDNTTISLSSGGNLQFASIAASVAANFTTPASGGTVNVTVSSSTGFVVGQWVRIPIAGYYSVTAVPDGTHVTLQNLGDPWNAGSGTTITSGAAILPWTSLGGTGGGSPGQNAFSTTSANFTVPAVSATVPVTMASTSWLGGAGYTVFIAGAGYYAVSSITDATHAVLTNLGYLATNAAPGTVINSGAMVTPGGIAGPSSVGTPGANAYDATTASFTVPAISTSVPVAIGNTAWLTVGQVVVIAGAGSYSVAGITSATVFSATNLNYSGNATVGAVIGSGAHVSPGGLIGPAGAGGAGLNAFTNLLANFTQPAALASVTINVGTTAWMVVGQAVFITSGGYYTVGSITDINHAVVMNLGYPGNATSGATIASGGGVSPSGLNGAAGANAFTSTTANFTMPTSGSTVTVTVAATSWMAQGQNLFIPSAGYFNVSVVTDATHVVLTNSGTIGNASAGTVINTGAQVSPAGSIGPTGTAGSGGGGGTATLFDPRNGIFIYDDFLWNPAYQAGSTLPQEWEGQGGGGGGAITFSSIYGLDATRRSQGIVELSTGVNASNNSGYSVARGKNSATANGSIMLGYGICDIAFRLALEEASLPPTGIGYVLRVGLWLQGTAGHPAGVANWYEGLVLEYSPDNNSGILRIGYFNNGYGGSGTTISYVNCTAGTPTPNGYGWWELKIDTAGNVTAWLNGTQIGSATGIAPLSLPMVPIVYFYRNSASTTNYHIALDTLYLNYPYTR